MAKRKRRTIWPWMLGLGVVGGLATVGVLAYLSYQDFRAQMDVQEFLRRQQLESAARAEDARWRLPSAFGRSA